MSSESAHAGETDDRGKPFALAAVDEIPPWKQWTLRQTLQTLVPLVFLAVPLTIGPRSFGFGPYGAAVVVFAATLVWTYWRGPTRPKWVKGLRCDSAWRLAHGKCARCDYPIANLAAAEDGCVVCPECGHAWQSQRFTMVGSDIDARDPLRALPDDSLGGLTLADDRNVELLRPLTWPPPWASAREAGSGGVHGDVVDEDEASRRAILPRIERVLAFEDRKRRIILMCAMVLPVPLVTAFAVLVVATQDRSDAAIVGLIVGLGVTAAAVSNLRRNRPIKFSILVFKLCPNCGARLDGAPQFDECIACGKCGRAWWV